MVVLRLVVVLGPVVVLGSVAVLVVIGTVFVFVLTIIAVVRVVRIIRIVGVMGIVVIVSTILVGNAEFLLALPDLEEAFHAFFLFLGLKAGGLAFQEVGQPDTDLVEYHHGTREEAEGKGVRGGSDEGGNDEDGQDGVGPGAAHHLAVEDAQLDQGHDQNGELETESEDKGELGGKRNVVPDAPLVLDHHVRAVIVEELKDLGQDDVVGEEDPGEEEAEADGHRGPEGLALGLMHAGQDKLQDEVEQEGEGDHDPREEGELDGEHEALGGFEGLHEDQFAACVGLGIGIALDQGKDLVPQGLVEAAVRFDELPLLRFILEGEGGTKEVDDPDIVEDLLGVLVIFQVVGAVLGPQLIETFRDVLGALPVLKGNPGVLQGSLLPLFPDLGDRTPDDVHELIAEDEADYRGNEQGEDDAGDAYPQILEVLEERLLSAGIGLIPELKHFLEEEHLRGPICLGWECPEVEGLVPVNTWIHCCFQHRRRVCFRASGRRRLPRKGFFVLMGIIIMAKLTEIFQGLFIWSVLRLERMESGGSFRSTMLPADGRGRGHRGSHVP